MKLTHYSKDGTDDGEMSINPDENGGYETETANDVFDIIKDRPLLWIVGCYTKPWSPALREKFGQELYETAQKLNAFIVTDGENTLYNRQVMEVVQEYNRTYDEKIDMIAIVGKRNYSERSAKLQTSYSHWVLFLKINFKIIIFTFSNPTIVMSSGTKTSIGSFTISSKRSS